MGIFRTIAAGLSLAAAIPAFGAEVVTNDVWRGCARTVYNVDGVRCWVVEPAEPRADRAWVWCTEWPDAFADRTGTDLFLKKGFYFLHAEVGTMSLGGPKCLEDMDKFYAFFTETLALASKGCLTGVSRGGLYAFRFAALHPERATCLYGDHAVLDFKSWPLHIENPGGRDEFMRHAGEINSAYGFKDVCEMLVYRGNPVDFEVIEPLAKAAIPVLLVVGEKDRTVPPEYNSNVFESRYRSMCGLVKTIRTAQYAHHPHGADDPSEIVSFVEKFASGDGVQPSGR